jgi:hypothetical protein
MTTSAADLAGYRWTSAEPTSAHAYLMPAVHCILTKSPSRKPGLGLKQLHWGFDHAELAHQRKKGSTHCL